MAKPQHLDITAFEQRAAARRALALQHRLELAAREAPIRDEFKREIEQRHWGALSPIATALGAVWDALQDGVEDLANLAGDLAIAVDEAVDAVTAPLQAGAMTLAEAFDVYAAVLPRPEWPRLFLAAEPQQGDRLVAELRREGLLASDVDRNDADFDQMGEAEAREFEAYSLYVVRIPPEGRFARRLAQLPGLAAMADPEVPVGLIRPARASGAAANVPVILDVPDELRDEYGHNVKLAILDTGLDTTHADFAHVDPNDCVAIEGDDVTKGADAVFDSLGHGTHCAGIAAGTGVASRGAYTGVAPNVRLFIGKVFSADGYASLESVVRGVKWAHEEATADIISMSLGTTGYAPGESVVSRMCEEVVGQGTLVCAAAGNEGPGAETIASPGDTRGVLTVGAIDKDLRVARFSSRGSVDPESALYGKPDIVGPGVSVCAPRSSQASGLKEAPGEFGEYYTLMDGTSMACPAIAGAAVLVLSAMRVAERSTPAIAARDALFDACEAIPGTSPHKDTGAGLPRVAQAISRIVEGVVSGRDLRERASRPLDRTAHAAGTAERTIATAFSATRAGESPASPGQTVATPVTPIAPVPLMPMGATVSTLAAPTHADAVIDYSTLPARMPLLVTPVATAQAHSTLPSPTDGHGTGSTTPRAFSSPATTTSAAPTSRPSPPPAASTTGPTPSSITTMPTSTATGDPSIPATAISRDRARKLEQEFLVGFTTRFYEMRAVANPLEGGRDVDINAAGETEAVYSERELLRTMLRGKPDAGDLRDYPHNTFREIALVRKAALLGPKVRKVVVVGACVSPLRELVDKGYAEAPANRGVLVDLIDRVIDSSETYFYIGVFSTTGWDKDLIDAVPQAANYSLFLLDVQNADNFRVHAPASFDARVRSAFDPETDESRITRCKTYLDNHPTLKTSGGFLLTVEVAEGANVPEPLARDVCKIWSKHAPDLEFGLRTGVHYVRRRRYS